MAAEVTVVFRDDDYNPAIDIAVADYELWLTGMLEALAGITVITVDLEEV